MITILIDGRVVAEDETMVNALPIKGSGNITVLQIGDRVRIDITGRLVKENLAIDDQQKDKCACCGKPY